jgi:hypothetical protein
MNSHVLFETTNYSVHRWPEADYKGQLAFAVWNKRLSRIEEGFSSDPGTKAYKYARRAALRLEKRG